MLRAVKIETIRSRARSKRWDRTARLLRFATWAAPDRLNFHGVRYNTTSRKWPTGSAHRFAEPLKQLQPAQHEVVAKRAGFPQFRGSLAPIKADPARRILLGFGDEGSEFPRGTFQRKRLLDHHRFSHVESRSVFRASSTFSGFGIDVDGQEIEFLRRFLAERIPTSARPVEAPSDQSDGDQVSPVVLCGSAATNLRIHAFATPAVCGLSIPAR